MDHDALDELAEVAETVVLRDDDIHQGRAFEAVVKAAPVDGFRGNLSDLSRRG